MIALAEVGGYTAVRWTGATQAIKDLAWLGLIEKLYAVNPITGVGFVGFTRGDLFPTLTTLTRGVDYLLDVSSDYALAEAEASPAGAFPAFNGYTPPAVAPAQPTESNTPAPAGGTIPGTVNTQIAATTIIGGTLVARVAAGLVPYSAKTDELRYLLFGLALNSALAGGTVQVQRNGYVTYPGLGLIPGATLLAGENGQIVYNNDGMGLHHVIGRAETPDSFSFSSSYTTIKISD